MVLILVLYIYTKGTTQCLRLQKTSWCSQYESSYTEKTSALSYILYNINYLLLLLGPKAIPYIRITKRKLKGEETEAMKEEVMRMAEKTKEEVMIRMEKEIGEEEGENDKQGPGTALLQPED